VQHAAPPIFFNREVGKAFSENEGGKKNASHFNQSNQFNKPNNNLAMQPLNKP
jgi:hypothetical protein